MHTYYVEVKMRLNRRDSEGKYLVSNDEHDVSNHDTTRRVDEERPALFGDTDAETEATEMADIVIRQNQIINRALRRQYRSRIARKAI